MTLTFRGTLDRAALPHALDAIAGLVEAPELEPAWDGESVLAGWSVGGVARHLVNQVETAVEFLPLDVPGGADRVSLTAYFDRVDWLRAPVDSPPNTSIRDEFTAMAAGRAVHSRAILAEGRSALPELLAAAGEETFVPWQGCVLATDDFLVCRLVEVVVHADDLAASLGLPMPAFDEDVLDPVVATLAALASRRQGAERTLRALARAERASGTVSAFG